MPITKILDNGSLIDLVDQDSRGEIIESLEKGSGITVTNDTEFVYITFPEGNRKEAINPATVTDPFSLSSKDLAEKIKEYLQVDSIGVTLEAPEKSIDLNGIRSVNILTDILEEIKKTNKYLRKIYNPE